MTDRHQFLCHACGKPAAHGYRLPGPRSQLPEGKSGYLWACNDHKSAAERRWKTATSTTLKAKEDQDGH